MQVTSVELVGLSETTVILKDRSGHVLYRSDPQTNTTVVARDADIPVLTVTVKEKDDSSVVPEPVKRIETKDPAAPRGRKLPIGCESMVSTLAQSDLPRTPSLCLAQAG